MRNNLYKVKLKDILSVKRGTSLSGQYYATEGNKIRLTLGNFNYPNGGFKTNTSKDNIYFSAPVKREYILKKGDIITPLTEQVAGLLGETAKIPEDDLYIQSGDIALIIPKEDKLDKGFAYYLISSKMIKYQLGAAAQQTKIRHTSPEKIENCEAWIPSDLNSQKNIAYFLDMLNDKITLNNKINQELEQMAKTLYEYWFVQFDFPDENKRPYKSANGKMVYNEVLKREIPEGWEVIKFDDIVEQAPKLKAIKAPDYKNQGNIPIVDQASTLITGRTDDTSYYYENERNCVVFGDVTTCFKFINFPFAKGTDGTKIINARNDRIPAVLLYQLLKNTKLPNIGFARHYMFLREIKLLLPPKDICVKYYQATKGIMDLIAKNIKENYELSITRDFLLPLLMNGQVSIQG